MLDEKEKEHVECIMELAAVLFGNEENCCHLWEHLFSLQDIAPSIVPGAMVSYLSYCMKSKRKIVVISA